MKTFEVTRKSDGGVVYRYSADAPIEWQGMGFTTHNHIEVIAAPAMSKLIYPYDSLIDVGAYFDRFGAAKMAVLTSTHPVVQAIILDASVRKWIDLTRQDVVQALGALATYVTAVTAEVQSTVMRLPVLPEENLALRKTYFSEIQ